MAEDKDKKPTDKDPKKKKTDDSNDNPRGGKGAKQTDQEPEALDPRQFVIINPQVDDIRLHENRSISQIDYLIRLGLGDQDHLNYYRQVFSSPKKANVNPNLRKYVSEVLEEVLGIIFTDTQMYNRLRTILQEKFKEVDKDNKEARGGRITESLNVSRMKQALRKRNV